MLDSDFYGIRRSRDASVDDHLQLAIMGSVLDINIIINSTIFQ
jgi:hypothetical protein